MTKIPTNKARQAGRGGQVLLILIVRLALAGAIWLGLEFYGEAIDSGSVEQPGGIQQPQTQQ